DNDGPRCTERVRCLGSPGLGVLLRFFERSGVRARIVPVCLALARFVRFANAAKLFRMVLGLEAANEPRVGALDVGFRNAALDAEQCERIIRPLPWVVGKFGHGLTFERGSGRPAKTHAAYFGGTVTRFPAALSRS